MLHRTTARDVFSDGTIAETSEVVHHEVGRAVDTVLAATSPDARREALANLLGECSAPADQTTDNLASGVEAVLGATTAMARREAVASLIGEACGLRVLIELAAMEFTEHCTWRAKGAKLREYQVTSMNHGDGGKMWFPPVYDPGRDDYDGEAVAIERDGHGPLRSIEEAFAVARGYEAAAQVRDATPGGR